jgi:hypothetical protein
MLELYLNDGVDEPTFVKLLEEDIQRTTKRTIERKNLDVSRFEKVWAERAGMRKQFKELPHDSN